jgi:hypothetical protein
MGMADFTIEETQTKQFAIVGKSKAGTVILGVVADSWTIDIPDATVVDGLVTAGAVATGSLTATVGDKSDTKTIEATVGPLDTIEIVEA